MNPYFKTPPVVKNLLIINCLVYLAVTLIDGVKNLSRFACISFEDALYCATASPAKMLGAYGEIGSIDEGKRANMIILDEDNNVSGVIFRGVRI